MLPKQSPRQEVGSFLPDSYMVEKDIVADLSSKLKQSVVGEVRFDSYSRTLYSTDASPYQIRPVGVVIPKTVEDVQVTAELCDRFRVPVLPRGAGTSLNGQSIGPAIVLDFSKYINEVVSINPEAATATVQPGMTVAELNNLLQPYNWMFGPDPASANRATIGGCMGTNASGSHSILYGMMVDNVISAQVLLSDASLVHFGPVDKDTIKAKARMSSLEGSLYRKIPNIVREAREDILLNWPRHWRRASGYNLDRLALALLSAEERAQLHLYSRFHPTASNLTKVSQLNLAQLITGSEGTLALVTEATLRIVPRPVLTALAIVHFETLLDACAAIPDILECEPSASELLDSHLIHLARSQPAWEQKLERVIKGYPGAILITEFYGNSEEELWRRVKHLEVHIKQRGWKVAVVPVMDPTQQQEVWAGRKAGLDLIMSRRSRYKPVPGIEDVSVPPDRLAEYMARIFDIINSMGDVPEVVVYAHASAGCLHVRPLLDLHTRRGVELMAELTNRACDLVLEFGGALSGEHGDGLSRSAFNPKLFGAALYRAMQKIKRAFDPKNIMNPGKIVDALPPTENLRYGLDYRPIELTTTFSWVADGGYVPAIEMCNGAAICRKIGVGTMCPSFMATRDERDSTRGRANVLRNALTGGVPKQELFSAEMYDVMDLCLGCKACKSECPSSVDMAKIKAEFLVHYFRQNGLPLFNRMMGMLPAINAWLFRLKPLIPLVNWSLRTSVIRALLARLGVHPNRTLPAYAQKSFVEWFIENSGSTPALEQAKKPVLLFHDTWTNYNEPHIGQAMVQVLQNAGYELFLLPGRKCCGRPLITGGQADKAREWIDHNIELLLPYVRQQVPIIGAEPSCILTLRDEYLALASDARKAHEVSDHVFAFEEFIMQETKAERFRAPWRPEAGRVLLHGHCHQKALVGNEPSIKVLEMAGYDVELIPSGCCGMAGDFGYHRDHYDISRTIAEDRLLPAIRNSDADVHIVASGTSCRHQITHFTGRMPIHLAEALAMALR